MDNAVSLVQAYLQVNGYFTVTEYPILEVTRHGISTATDLDVLAFRFPGAGRLVPGRGVQGVRWKTEVDPALGCPLDQVDMVVGEVKEGKAVVNPAARDRRVLQAALVRFGCCGPGHVSKAVDDLQQQGWSDMPNGHRIRVLAFGSQLIPESQRHYHAIALGQVVSYLQSYLDEHWDTLRHAEFKHPAFGFLMALEKARRGAITAGLDK